MERPVVATFGEIIASHAAARGGAIALRYGQSTWTYAGYQRQANRIAAMLVTSGYEKSARIAWIGLNSDVVPLLALAAATAGMIFVPVNWRLADAEVRHILADCGASCLFIGDLPCERIAAFQRSGMAVRDAAQLTDPAGKELPGPLAAPTENDPEAICMLVYTSGTTGVPKGVMLSHRSLFATSACRQIASVPWDDWSSSDVTLVPVPLAHIGGFGMLARTLFFGGEVVIQPTFEAGQVLGAIDQDRISKLGLVPTALKMVIDHPRSRQVDYSRIRTIVYGAAPISTDLLREAIEVFGCEFAQSYGMTETSSTCVALPPEDHDVAGNPRMRAAGKPLPGTQLRITGDEGVPVPAGVVGEIEILSVAIMAGYWGKPDDTAAVLGADGWYRTGDAGYLDEDGYLYIMDRKKDMIITGAENVYPAEVENALASHTQVSECAVIGVPHPLWGESVMAIIVPQAGATPEKSELEHWARQSVAGYKVPRSWAFVQELPRNASGKIDKAALRRTFITVSDAMSQE